MSNRNLPMYFTKQRDYAAISKIERDFFAGLNTNVRWFGGHENPGESGLSVMRALSDTTQFQSSKGDTFPLEVLVSFDISDCRERVDLDHMYLGTLLKPSKSKKEQQVTHFIALTKGNSCKMKIHLDLDFDLESDEPKPSPHFQCGGRIFKVKKKQYDLCWDHSIDKPRLPSLPFCTPSLWHSAFLEFQECASVRPFVFQSWWQNLVRDAEESLWGCFAENMRQAVTAKKSIIQALYPQRN